MTSVLNVDTIADKAGTGAATLTGQFTSKAWVNFNGTSTVAIRQSGNVASITDGGTGVYTVNFASSIVDADYCAVASTGRDDSNGANLGASFNYAGTNPTTSAIKLNTRDRDSSTNDDTDYVFVTVVRQGEIQMASLLKVDALTGVTTANDITVTVGASVTAKLQQSLATTRHTYDQPASTTVDSLNISSATDVSTGLVLSTFSNAYSSATQRQVLVSGWNTNDGGSSTVASTARGINAYQDNANNATNTVRTQTTYGANASGNGAVADVDGHYVAIFGDLA